MRILLIAGIVFVHIPYDPSTSPYLGTHGVADFIRIYLGDSLFRIGVPCLSAISGYLLFRRGLAGFDHGKVLRSKARTVLLPFLIWNLSFLALVLVAQRAGIGSGYLPDVIGATPRELASLAFALEAWPINLPLYFLRDLLLCLVLAPLIGHAIMRFPKVTLALFLAFAILPFPNLIFLKKSILFGFSVGVWAALHQVDVKRLDGIAWPVVLSVGIASVLLAVGLYATGPDYPEWMNVLRGLVAISGIAGAWALSSILVRTRFGKALSGGGGQSFWIFCAHYPVLIVLWMVWNRLGNVPYPLFYVGAPLVTLALLVIAHAVVRQLAPGLLALLTGDRVGPSLRTPPATEGRAPTELSSQHR